MTVKMNFWMMVVSSNPSRLFVISGTLAICLKETLLSSNKKSIRLKRYRRWEPCDFVCLLLQNSGQVTVMAQRKGFTPNIFPATKRLLPLR